MANVVTVGSGTLDRVFSVENIPVAGTKATAQQYRESGGGIAATAAVAIARLGGGASYWGVLGQDSIAEIILAELKAYGVATNGVHQIASAQSATSCVIVDQDSERQITTFPGTALAQAGSDLLPKATLQDVDALMIDFRWPTGAKSAAKTAREKGIPVVCDLDLGSEDTAHQFLDCSDYILFSAPMLRKFSGQADLKTALRNVQSTTSGQVGVTDGENGFYWQDNAGNLNHVPAFLLTMRDTTGAGDVFHGAFALAVAEGKDFRNAGTFASAAAALKCQNGDGWAGIADRKSTEELIRSR